ncbi:MAG: formyltransferase family protein [Alphaproteobacteria bacterium]
MPYKKNITNKIHPCDVLYISENSAWGEIGYEAVCALFDDVTPILWSPGMPKPDIDDWHGDWVISFKSDLILPVSVIEEAQKGALNFHPAPPQYRGIGGYWWALHNNDDIFGVTVHHMNERIDHGDIIKVDYFPILQDRTEESLKQKAAYFSLNLLNTILRDIIDGKSLYPCGAQWGSHLYTQKELKEAKARIASKAMIEEKLVTQIAS